jgi:hypothetical protein
MSIEEEKDKAAVVRQGFEDACREFSSRVSAFRFERTKKHLWTRVQSHWVDFVHFHRNGMSYGAPITFSIDIRIHWGVRILNDSFPDLHLNGPYSDPNRLRSGHYHLRFNARSGSTYDRFIEDLSRFFVEQSEPWFNQFASVESLLKRPNSPLNDDEKRFLTEAVDGNPTGKNLALSLKELGIKSK